MGVQQQIGTPPMPAVARILARYERPQLEAFLAIAIDLLDTMDPDPDMEAGGDEMDHSSAEDDFVDHNAGGPGCPLADPDMAADDVGCDDTHDDRECEQMAGDVPTVPCFAIEPDADGKRRFLGHWNPGSFIGA